MGSTGLSGTHGLMLAWVQVTHISAVVTIVTWDQPEGQERLSPPTFPLAFSSKLPSFTSFCSEQTIPVGCGSAVQDEEAQRVRVTQPQSHGKAKNEPPPCSTPADLSHFPGPLALDPGCTNSCPSVCHCSSYWRDMGLSHRGLAGCSLAPR